MRSPKTAFLIIVAACGLLAAAPAFAQDDGEEYRTVASYLVRSGALAADPDFRTAIPAKAAQDYRTVWAYLSKLVPADLLPYIGKFQLFVYDTEPEYVSDGTTALAEDGESWEFAVNFQNAQRSVLQRSREDLAYFDIVAAHEIAHILALNKTQLAPEGAAPAGAYAVEEGTTKPAAYLNKFYQAFWKGKYPDWAGEASTGDDAAALYAAHPDDFVTEYAATSPNEDFAETFAEFVVKPKPAGATAAAKKVLFFYGFPELAAARDAMRRAMASLQ